MSLGYKLKKVDRSLQRGSVLIFSFLILSVITSVSFAVLAIFLPKLKIVSDPFKSSVAISVANSGLEWCLYVNRGKPTPEPLPPPSFINGATLAIYYPLTSTTIAACVSTETPMSHRAVGTYLGVTRSLEIEETP